ncbi:MGH1-like glycoside hydrolase domain-containing protein [Sphingomonas oryzagri]|uniref:Glycogen debranching protein n=1 Tax=Sphingomonas oryzagri TaxID=3042314 RepID=A0ABT6N797_9SPHN|nr:glycogen debranching protein [Sphingomonas oryzagri]MDH7640987.1 glycogen debranching protein [Sphingomonas oryzagri]
MRRLRILLAALLVGAAAPLPAALPLDEHRIAVDRFGNDAPWYEGNIPFFEASDPLLTRIFYYRWQIFRAHQRDLGRQGYISTEFLDDVSWQREPYASLNDATAFHIVEGRWLRDRRYADDYVNFLYEGGGNDRHFSEGIAGAVWGRYLADGDATAATRHLDAMRHVYNLWDDHFDFDRRLYWIEPLLDATEYTISSIDASGGKDGFRGGDAFRPSINAYMFDNARAIGRIAALAGDEATAADYAARAADLKAHVEADLWSPALGHFVDRYQKGNEYVRAWAPIRGRELVGYLPWTVDMVTGDPRFASAWSHLLSPAELGGPKGMRTVEPSYQYYMRQYRYDAASGGRECQWNGPVWPFQTTQALTGLANLLEGPPQTVATRSDYLRLLHQYAALHMLGDHPDLQEDYDPQTGKPIVGLARSHHYFHSGFDDLIVTGLAGLRPRADDVLEVAPLIPADPKDPEYLPWFALQDVPYHGHLVTILWDADGSRYGHGAGLTLLVDGAQVAHSVVPERLTVPLPRKPLAPIERPIDLAVNLVRSDYPKGSASVNADPAALHGALDGRVWFFPEMANGWSTIGSAHAWDWFAVDLGKAAQVHAAELAFYADGKDFAVPSAYRLQVWDGGWKDVPAASLPPPVANGITRIAWPAISSAKLRLLVKKPARAAVRLVEIKLF